MKNSYFNNSSINVVEVEGNHTFEQTNTIITGPNETLREEKTTEESEWSKKLKQISLGQYKTPLYYKKNESYSSRAGGIITLVAGIIFLIYAITLLVKL